MTAPQEVAARELGGRARRGIGLLLTRHAVTQATSLVTGIVVARSVLPEELGRYFAASAVLGALSVLVDLGIAARLVQRSEGLEARELRLALTLQLVVAIALLGGILFAVRGVEAAGVAHDAELVGLLLLLALDLVYQAWRSVQAIELERQLRYERLAPVELCEQLTFAITCAAFAFAGWGAWSFVWATWLRGAAGAMTLCGASTSLAWPTWSLAGAPAILRAGRPFQVASFFQGLAGWTSTAVVAAALGPAELGLVNWAAGQARRPLPLVGIFARVAFPYFSRLESPEAVTAAMTRLASAVLAGLGLWIAVLVAAGEPAVRFLFTERWTPAVPAMIAYAATLGLDALIWLAAAAQNARGLVYLATRRAAARTAATIGITVPLLLTWGHMGAPVGYFIAVLVTLPLSFAGLGPGSLARTLSSAAWVAAPTTLAALLGAWAGSSALGPAEGALAAVGVAAATYALVAWAICPREVREAADLLLRRAPGSSAPTEGPS